MTHKALRGASFKSTEELVKTIHNFITAYGSKARPFVWRKREVKGSPLRNTITNLGH
jgi:phosphoribosyl-AMP cyclohydrolase